jgi:hypothetical protein
MMQPCASAAKLRSGGPILFLGITAMGRTGPKLLGAFSNLRLLRRAPNDAVRHHALSHEPPQGDQKLARQGHDHELALTARFLGAGSKPLRQCAVLLKHEKSPRQLDHTSANSSVAGTGQPFLPAFRAALVARAREASITRYGPWSRMFRDSTSCTNIRRSRCQPRSRAPAGAPLYVSFCL